MKVERADYAAGRTTNKKRVGLATQLLIFIAVSGGMAVAAYLFREQIQRLGSWGYLGAFIINGISSATILFPGPGAAVLLVMARDFNPIWLGVAAGLGGALGSGTSYVIGRMAADAIEKKRIYPAMHWTMRHVGGLILFLVTLIPFLPSDAIGILAGATRYPVERYFLWVGLASVIKMALLLTAVTVSWGWVEPWLDVWNLFDRWSQSWLVYFFDRLGWQVQY